MHPGPCVASPRRRAGRNPPFGHLLPLRRGRRKRPFSHLWEKVARKRRMRAVPKTRFEMSAVLQTRGLEAIDQFERIARGEFVGCKSIEQALDRALLGVGAPR